MGRTRRELTMDSLALPRHVLEPIHGEGGTDSLSSKGVEGREVVEEGSRWVEGKSEEGGTNGVGREGGSRAGKRVSGELRPLKEGSLSLAPNNILPRNFFDQNALSVSPRGYLSPSRLIRRRRRERGDEESQRRVSPSVKLNSSSPPLSPSLSTSC